jgi:hypothetical protein
MPEQFARGATIARMASTEKKDLAGPHFSPRGEMIAQKSGFTAHFLKKRNTDCIPD